MPDTYSKDSDPDSSQRLLVVRLTGQPNLAFACFSENFVGIDSVQALQKIPKTQPWFLGLCGYHGQILAVNDLSTFLFSKACFPLSHNRFILMKHDVFYYGFLIERVVGFFHFSPLSEDELQQSIPQLQNSPIPLPEIKLHPKEMLNSTALASSKYVALNIKHILDLDDFYHIGMGKTKGIA